MYAIPAEGMVRWQQEVFRSTLALRLGLRGVPLIALDFGRRARVPVWIVGVRLASGFLSLHVELGAPHDAVPFGEGAQAEVARRVLGHLEGRGLISPEVVQHCTACGGPIVPSGP